MRASTRTASAFAALVAVAILTISPIFAASPYAPNVTSQTSNQVTVSGGNASVDNTASTGVSASITGLSGASSATIQTQSLNSPSTGVGTFSTSGTAAYFDVKVTLPSGASAGSATATVCFSSPSVSSTDTLYYWSGSSWTQASSVTVTPPKICGSVPVSALTGTNFVAAPPSAADYTLYYVGGFVVVIIVIVIAILVMRRPKRSP